jgi:hypothetical protein
MRFTNEIKQDIYKVARFHYLDKYMCQAWNRNRNANELRLLTGWVWQSKIDNKYQMGLKTQTAALRDAYYVLLEQRSAPGVVNRIRRVA